MSQLIKHYWINRENGAWSVDTRFGLMMPSIQGLEIQHQLTTENDVPFFLSIVPDYTLITETEGEGLKVITQTDWDNELTSFDTRQEEKRYNILRKHRDEMLRLTDWIVIKAKEQDVELSVEFKDWRQALRDLPSGNFPSAFPTPPSDLENHSEIQDLCNRFDEVRSIPMINDPLNQ